MTAILFYRDGHVEVVEDVRTISESYTRGVSIDVRQEPKYRDDLDVVKVEILP